MGQFVAVLASQRVLLCLRVPGMNILGASQLFWGAEFTVCKSHGCCSSY